MFFNRFASLRCSLRVRGREVESDCCSVVLFNVPSTVPLTPTFVDGLPLCRLSLMVVPPSGVRRVPEVVCSAAAASLVELPSPLVGGICSCGPVDVSCTDGSFIVASALGEASPVMGVIILPAASSLDGVPITCSLAVGDGLTVTGPRGDWARHFSLVPEHTISIPVSAIAHNLKLFSVITIIRPIVISEASPKIRYSLRRT